MAKNETSLAQWVGVRKGASQRATKALTTLENFERTGNLPEEMSELDAHQYLSMRRMIARPSARDEWRILARLLISGPSTASNLERELNISYAFAHQTLCLFESIGIFTRYGNDAGKRAAVGEDGVDSATSWVQSTL